MCSKTKCSRNSSSSSNFRYLLHLVIKLLKRSIMRSLRKYLIFTLTFCFILNIPSALALIGCMIFIRHVAVLLAKILRPDLGSIVPASSAIFGTDLIYNNNTLNRPSRYPIVIAFKLRGKMNLEQLRLKVSESIEKKILLSNKSLSVLQYPQLKQYVYSWFGILFWKWETNFTIENHVNLLDVDAEVEHASDSDADKSSLNGECQDDDDDLLTFVGLGNDLFSKPFAKGQSPWEFLLVQDSRRKGNDQETSIVIFRVHHVLGDGRSLMKFCLGINNENLESEEIARNSMSKPAKSGLAHDVARLVINTWDFKSICSARSLLMPPSGERTLKFSVSDSIPLSYLKTIKDEYGISMTSVLLSALTGALRNYYWTENKSGPHNKLPASIHCLTALPFPGSSANQMSNHMSACVIRLPMQLSTPHVRLQAIEQNFQQEKSSTLPTTLFHLMKFNGLNFAPISRLLFATNFHACAMSNFAGPSLPTNFAGYEILDGFFAAGFGHQHQGIGLTALSYNGRLRLTIIGTGQEFLSSNRQLDYHEFTDLLMKELETLGNNDFLVKTASSSSTTSSSSPSSPFRAENNYSNSSDFDFLTNDLQSNHFSDSS